MFWGARMSVNHTSSGESQGIERQTRAPRRASSAARIAGFTEVPVILAHHMHQLIRKCNIDIGCRYQGSAAVVTIVMCRPGRVKSVTGSMASEVSIELINTPLGAVT